MRLRLKCEELEKSCNDKSTRLRDVQGELLTLQQMDVDIGYYREEASSLKSTIGMLEDTIITLNRENEKLKDLARER